MPLLPEVQPPGKGATVSEPPPGAAAGVSDTTAPGPLTAGAASVAEGAGVTTFPAVVPGSLCAGAGAAAVGAGSAAAGAGAAAVGAGDAAVVDASAIAWPGPGAGDAVAGACVTGAMMVSPGPIWIVWTVPSVPVSPACSAAVSVFSTMVRTSEPAAGITTPLVFRAMVFEWPF